MNGKLIFSVLMLMLMGLAACDNKNTESNLQPPSEQGKAIYLRSDVDDETWVKIHAADERGHKRYVAAKEKDANSDSGQVAK